MSLHCCCWFCFCTCFRNCHSTRSLVKNNTAGFGVIRAINIIVNIKGVCFTAKPDISNFPIPICTLSRSNFHFFNISRILFTIKIHFCQATAVRTNINMPVSFQVSAHIILCTVIVINVESRREDASTCRAFHNSHGSTKFCVTCIVFCGNSNLRTLTIIFLSVQSGFHLRIIHIVGYLECNLVIICSRRYCLRLGRKENPAAQKHKSRHHKRKAFFEIFFHKISSL